MKDVAGRNGGARGRWARGVGAGAVALALATTVTACGQERYEYGEKKIAVDRPAAPARTVDDLRAVAGESTADPQTQMGENLPLPAGLPADLPMPQDAHAVNVITANPGYFEWSVVLLDPPGPLAQVLRGFLDDTYDGFVRDGVPVQRETRTDEQSGAKRDVVEAELDGRAVEISMDAEGYHLAYAVENAR